ncbi:hypothetical protein [Caproiciproducens galactitolivorans]|uniref:Uncharacterized protein n=1 Tax=Caproiciproducens galactitolivorans TaxID=642589 RepID=A0ABT4BR52_9FIRM|nr:hypothetical protein [Caproiciproducens galactitolivorans]MCY1713377.1 hypothetical protein [Caproiciproducens galactitolivorans]
MTKKEAYVYELLNEWLEINLKNDKRELISNYLDKINQLQIKEITDSLKIKMMVLL